MNPKQRHLVTTLWLTLLVTGLVNILMQRKYSNIQCRAYPLEKQKQSTATVTHQIKRSAIEVSHFLNNSQNLAAGFGRVVDCVTWLSRKQNLTNLPTKDFLTSSFQEWKGPSEDGDHRLKTFQRIFEKRDWLGYNPDSKFLQASGPGALLINAQNAIAALHTVIMRIKSTLRKDKIRLLDLPCGDLQWMRHFLMSRTDVEYYGMDIVPGIIDHHQKEYGHVKRLHFSVIDIVNTQLRESYDLILCRDMLQHLTVRDAGKVLQHFSDSNSRFLLVTTHPDSSVNQDVDLNQLGGRFSRYNLEKAPFLLAPPVCSSYDYNREHLALWSIPLQQQLPQAEHK